MINYIQCRHQRPRQATTGFTLIELLVVIAIVGVLASLLLPVIARVQEVGNRTQCMANLRQLSTAILSYAGDNNETLPGPIYRSIRGPDTKPSNHYLSFAGTSAVSPYITQYLGQNHNVWRCPSNQAAYNANAGKLVYVLNNQSTTQPPEFFGDVDTQVPAKSMLQIKSAGQIVYANITGLASIWMISDIDGVNFNSTNSLGSIYSLDPVKQPPPHSGGRNYVFFDGHAAYCTANNFPPNP